MKILLLTSWFLVLVLLYLRFQSKWNIRRSMREAEKKKESDTGNYSSDDDAQYDGHGHALLGGHARQCGRFSLILLLIIAYL